MLPHSGHFCFGLGMPVQSSSDMNPPQIGHLFEVIYFTSCQTCEKTTEILQKEKRGERRKD